MPTQFITDFDNLLKSIESFYLKYGVDAEKLENIKNRIDYLKSLDFNYVNNISKIENVVKKLEKTIDNLNVTLKGLNNILFDYYANYKNYPKLKKYFVNREYYSQEDRDKAFQKQLEHNDYDIYLMNGLQLVNLFDKKKTISFDTEDELNEFMENCIEVIIKPKTNNFEVEFKNYYNYLLRHGYNYSIDNHYGPFTIATELASFFDGTVLTNGFILYSKRFEYPKDFNNEEYLEKLKELLMMQHDETFVKDYREMRLLEKKIQAQIERLFQISRNYSDIINQLKENTNTISLGNEILFLQKCYTAWEPKFGYGEYKYVDYYKAIDGEFLRKLLNDNNIGAWRTACELKHSYNRDYNVCIWKEGFSWAQCADVNRHNKKLEDELNSIPYSEFEVIENLIQDKYIIEANSKLNYDTLLSEYHLNFGMNPKDFVKMIQSKYGCKVVCPNRESQSTRMIVRKPA